MPITCVIHGLFFSREKEELYSSPCILSIKSADISNKLSAVEPLELAFLIEKKEIQKTLIAR